MPRGRTRYYNRARQGRYRTLKKKLKAILRITIITLVAIIVGVNVYTLNATRLAGNSIPMPFGVGAAVVLSGSMEPELSTGDMLIVAERESYSVGDVIVYQDGRTSVTHRIVAISDDEVITRGDANNTDDAPISIDNIKGRVVFVVPFIGYIANAIKTPIGTIVILALSVFLLERSFRSTKEKDDKELESIKAEIERLKQQQEKNS